MVTRSNTAPTPVMSTETVPAQPMQNEMFFFTLVPGPRRSLSLKLSDTRVYEPQIPARLGTTAHFCEVPVLKLRVQVVGFTAPTPVMSTETVPAQPMQNEMFPTFPGVVDSAPSHPLPLHSSAVSSGLRDEGAGLMV